jgi:hypothetical protein
LDALVAIVDGPAKPHEYAERFFNYKMGKESLFEAMYTLRSLAERANIESTEVVAQMFMSLIPSYLRTAILKDHKGKGYIKLKLDDLLALARQEESVSNVTTPSLAAEQWNSNTIKQVDTEHPEPTSRKSEKGSEPPQWFKIGMDSVINRLERLETANERTRTPDHAPRSNETAMTKENKAVYKCRNCRGIGHFVKKCPQRFCQACGQRGHGACMDVCPNRNL